MRVRKDGTEHEDLNLSRSATPQGTLLLVLSISSEGAACPPMDKKKCSSTEDRADGQRTFVLRVESSSKHDVICDSAVVVQ